PDGALGLRARGGAGRRDADRGAGPASPVRWNLTARGDRRADGPPSSRRGRPMIDVHSHVLPGIDDGTKQTDEAIAFCRQASEAGGGGTEVLVAPPNHRPGWYSTPGDGIRECVEDLQKRCDAAGVRIRIAPGCEVFSDSGLPEKIANGEVLTYGDARRHILLE